VRVIKAYSYGLEAGFSRGRKSSGDRSKLEIGIKGGDSRGDGFASLARKPSALFSLVIFPLTQQLVEDVRLLDKAKCSLIGIRIINSSFFSLWPVHI
jgi:hypothetical protein